MSKKQIAYSILIVVFTVSLSCDPFLDFDPPTVDSTDTTEEVEEEGNGGGGNGGGGNGGGGSGDNTITVVISENDPQNTGSCDYLDGRSSMIDLLDIIEIPDSLPEAFDLSEFMPPVRSQGSQGSCAAWATVYYLKSYQEKVQYEYEYESFDDVFSPAFTYNQLAFGNCGGGSSLNGNLHILQTQGVMTWADFPYDDSICTTQPTSSQVELAENSKIGDYFSVGVPDSISDPNYTKINVMKTLLSESNPLVMSFSIKEVDFSSDNNLFNAYLGVSFTPDPSVTCGHAVLIVGYDDALGAFKFVNSWGTFWGNEGYAWLSYDFFLPETDPDYIEGVSQTIIAYDKIEDGT